MAEEERFMHMAEEESYMTRVCAFSGSCGVACISLSLKYSTLQLECTVFILCEHGALQPILKPHVYEGKVG